MTFATASLLYGSALVAVPIILHLVMRRKPRLLEFPALRFVERRHDANQRRLRLRHLLLLLLRMAAIALLALALARPSVKFSGLAGSQEAPVAAALVFDAAPRMEYRHDNQTRLEVARQWGASLLAELPRESEMAVLDTRQGPRQFVADRGVAKQRIEGLKTAPNSQPLIQTVEEAARLLGESELPRKEIYVFTDLSRDGLARRPGRRLAGRPRAAFRRLRLPHRRRRQGAGQFRPGRSAAFATSPLQPRCARRADGHLLRRRRRRSRRSSCDWRTPSAGKRSPCGRASRGKSSFASKG